jgi:hypothetical protein
MIRAWGVWDEPTLEQRAVMINAVEEAFLVCVMDKWRARQRWAETGSTQTPSNLDDEAKRQLIPRFTDIVLNLVDRDRPIPSPATTRATHSPTPPAGYPT